MFCFAFRRKPTSESVRSTSGSSSACSRMTIMRCVSGRKGITWCAGGRCLRAPLRRRGPWAACCPPGYFQESLNVNRELFDPQVGHGVAAPSASFPSLAYQLGSSSRSGRSSGRQSLPVRGCSSSARAIPTCSISRTGTPSTSRRMRMAPTPATIRPGLRRIGHLKALQRRGAGYLLIPGPASGGSSTMRVSEVPRRLRRGGVSRDRSVRDLPPAAAFTRRLTSGSIEFKHHEPVEFVCS